MYDAFVTSARCMMTTTMWTLPLLPPAKPSICLFVPNPLTPQRYQPATHQCVNPFHTSQLYANSSNSIKPDEGESKTTTIDQIKWYKTVLADTNCDTLGFCQGWWRDDHDEDEDDEKHDDEEHHDDDEGGGGVGDSLWLRHHCLCEFLWPHSWPWPLCMGAELHWLTALWTLHVCLIWQLVMRRAGSYLLVRGVLMTRQRTTERTLSDLRLIFCTDLVSSLVSP